MPVELTMGPSCSCLEDILLIFSLSSGGDNSTEGDRTCKRRGSGRESNPPGSTVTLPLFGKVHSASSKLFSTRFGVVSKFLLFGGDSKAREASNF